MATKKKNTLNEDVDLLNEGEKASETPATLVSPSPDQEYNKDGALLSPNPAKSGFTSQRVVDSLPGQGEYNVIYIVPIKNNGGIIGYRKWRWDVETSSYKRVYGSIPNLALGNGQRETPVINSNPNRNSTKVFNEDVVFNGQVKIGGKNIEDYIDSEGGVTEKELQDALLHVDTQLALKANLAGANFTGAITAPSIIENMSGYTFTKQAGLSWTPVFVGAVKNGNKITFVVFGSYIYASGNTAGQLGYFNIPASVGARLYPYSIGALDNVLYQANVAFYKNDNVDNEGKNVKAEIQKGANTYLPVNLRRLNAAGFTDGETYIFRFEATFLLSDNLAQ